MLLSGLSSSTPSNLLLCSSEFLKFDPTVPAAMLFLLTLLPLNSIKGFGLNDLAKDGNPSNEQLPQWWTGFLCREKAFTCEHYYFQRLIIAQNDGGEALFQPIFSPPVTAFPLTYLQPQTRNVSGLTTFLLIL